MVKSNMLSNKEFAEKVLFRKNFQNIAKTMELRENWSLIFPEENLQAVAQQMLCVAKDLDCLTLLCSSEFFLSCYNKREEIKNRINIYFGKVCIESVRVFAQFT